MGPSASVLSSCRVPITAAIGEVLVAPIVFVVSQCAIATISECNFLASGCFGAFTFVLKLSLVQLNGDLLLEATFSVLIEKTTLRRTSGPCVL